MGGDGTPEVAPPASAAGPPVTAAPGAAAAEGGGGQGAAEQDSGSAPAPAPLELSKLHLLPFEETHQKLERKNRIEFMAPELRRMRSQQEVLRTGDLIRHDDLDFAVVKCEPPEGTLGLDTDYFIDGEPLVCFEKIQFSAWGPGEMTSEALFSECIAHHFKGDYTPYGSPQGKRVRLFYADQIFQIGDVFLQVEATEPQGLGVVSTQTEIFANWDHTPEFDKVHIVPFQDTLPRAYQFDIFQDYLRPYLSSNIHRRFQCNELFMYHGVQFKMVACEPNVAARIGKGTTIFCEGVLHPSLRNLLPPDLLRQVAQLPPGLQMLLLNTERTTRELEDMLTQRRRLFEETLSEIHKFTWPLPDATESSQQTCMICLVEFADGDECRKLPCRHIFHADCVDEWLRRCTDCPICKDNVDRAIRNY